MEYIKYIKTIPSEEGKLAELALYRRQPEEAERILLQAKPQLVYRAIKLNIRIYRWERALEIAQKFKSHVDTVLGYRQRFLETFQKKEDIPKFKQYRDTQVDWAAIAAKEQEEEEEERNRVDEGDRGRGSRK